MKRRFWSPLLFALGSIVLLCGVQADEQKPPQAKEEAPSPKPQLKLFDELLGGKGGGLTLANDGKELTLSAEFKVAENSRAGILAVTAKMAKGWHVYSVTQPVGKVGPMPTKLTVKRTEQFEVVGPFQSDRKPQVKSYEVWTVPAEEHEGEVVWSALIKFAEGVDPAGLVIPVRFDGQVCEKSCIPKDNIVVEAKYAGVLDPATAVSPVTSRENTQTSTSSDGFRATDAKLVFQGSVDKQTVAPGGKLKLEITATPDPDWHVYALEKRDPKLVSKPTLIVLDQTNGWQVGEPVPSASPVVKKAVDKLPESRYYTEPVTWTITLSAPSDAKEGPQEIAGLIGYQTCKDKSCLAPDVAEFRVSVTIGSEEKLESAPLAFREPPPATKLTYGKVAELAESQAGGSGLDLAKIKVDNATAKLSLAWVLPIALLGGFILNFMPCVLPVIGLKILSFVQQAGESRGRVFALNLWYSLGMLAVFMVLATLAVVWNFGWGEQNNSDVFNIVMAAVVFTMGLSFLGVWEIPIPGFVGSGKASELARREGPAGAFFKGAITTVLATPCSGPGLATALAWCQGKPSHLVYLVFACLGLGMALPYLVIGAFPALVKFLPKPGAWMETFKQLMGFVLLGTVVFIFTYLQITLIVPSIALLFGLWAACWWIGRTPLTAEMPQTARAWLFGVAFAGIVGWISFAWLADVMDARFLSAVDRELSQRQLTAVARVPAPKSEHELPWQPFSIDKLKSLTAENKTVMVDFTADWCLVCKTLEATVLNTRDVQNAVEEHRVETLVADWTTRDPKIAEVLNSLGSKQVPVLAIFPAGRPNEPIVLIGGYTQATLIKRLKEASSGQAGDTSTAMK